MILFDIILPIVAYTCIGLAFLLVTFVGIASILNQASHINNSTKLIVNSVEESVTNLKSISNRNTNL